MKLKSIVVVLLLSICLGTSVFAQEKPEEEPKYGWKKEMVGGINLTQTSLSNWTQGGEDSFAWQLNFNFKFINNQEKSNWANSGKLTYGSTKLGDQEFRKSLDEIKLESVLTYKLGIHINPFVAFTAETQFAPGYNYDTAPKTQISAFMDPGYFRESIGVGYYPNEIVKTRLGVALKQTITSNYPVPYADVVTSTTHKTLRGPRGGFILCPEKYAKDIDKLNFPGTQGGPFMHVIAAKAVCFREAMTEEFKT